MSITVEHLTLSNPTNRQHSILQDVSCQLADGTITLLIGQTGAGKSSLLDVLTGLRAGEEGTVRYEEHSLWNGKRVNQAVQNEIGVVFQYPEHQLFARTVQSEFDYSLKPLRLSHSEIEERTLTALRDMGLPASIRQQSPLVLSGGQKRRVALGTTFATRPKWLFLDEPTAGLDPQAVEQFLHFLKSWKKQTSGGVLIATHDLDALFPIADRVLVLDGGRLVANLTPAELCQQPHILLQARIGLPSSTRLAIAFEQKGISIPSELLSPDEMAAMIAQEMERGRTLHTSEPILEHADLHSQSSTLDCTAATVGGSIPTVPVSEEATRHLIYNLDPRAKWLFYILISIGILLQEQWFGIGVAAAVTAVLVYVTGVPIRDIRRVAMPFLYFILFSTALSGIGFADGFHFETGPAMVTFQNLFRFLLMVVVGVLLPATTSQLRMKRGLEQSLSPLAKLKLPVEAFSLAASLLLRFVPVIMQELERFSRITRARGKSRSKSGRIRLRDIPAILIPLLMSVLQLGEDLSLAMEARGYKRMGQKRTASIQLQMNRRDLLTIGIGLLALGLLIVVI